MTPEAAIQQFALWSVSDTKRRMLRALYRTKLTTRELAAKVGISESMARGILIDMRNAGVVCVVEYRGKDSIKVFTLGSQHGVTPEHVPDSVPAPQPTNWIGLR